VKLRPYGGIEMFVLLLLLVVVKALSVWQFTQSCGCNMSEWMSSEISN